jgi:hypothetical protein
MILRDLTIYHTTSDFAWFFGWSRRRPNARHASLAHPGDIFGNGNQKVIVSDKSTSRHTTDSLDSLLAAPAEQCAKQEDEADGFGSSDDFFERRE